MTREQAAAVVRAWAESMYEFVCCSDDEARMAADLHRIVRRVHREARRQALEEAAGICEELRLRCAWADAAQECGRRIRALIDEGGER